MRLRARIKTVIGQSDEAAMPLFFKWMKDSALLYVFEVETDGQGKIVSLRVGELLPDSPIYSSEFRRRFTYDIEVKSGNIELLIENGSHRLADIPEEAIRAFWK